MPKLPAKTLKIIGLTFALTIVVGMIVGILFVYDQSFIAEWQYSRLTLGMSRAEVESRLGAATVNGGAPVTEEHMPAVWLRKNGWQGDVATLNQSWWMKRKLNGEFLGVWIVFDGDEVVFKRLMPTGVE